MKDANHKFQKRDVFIVAMILVVAIATRLYKINTPLADLHSWRQVDTAAVARNFVQDGFDLLHPRYDDLSNSTGRENPQGYRMVEFPIYNGIHALVYKVFPPLGFEAAGRLTTAFFSLILIAIIYYFALKEVGRVAAFFAALVYAIFPFFVFFSRVILPETTALSFSFLALFFLYLYATTNKKGKSTTYYILSVICFAVGMLIKPPVIFFSLAALYLMARKHSFGIFKNPFFYLYFLLVAAPLLAWRYYISSYPEGVPPSAWLIKSVNTFEGHKDIFFRPAFFRWIFFERINILMLGGFLSVFFAIGLLVRQKRLFIHAIVLSSLLYLFVFQGGNVQHEYYQTLILPAVALCVGCGIQFIVEERKKFISPLFVYPIVATFLVLSLYFSYYNVRNFYNYSQELKQIGEVISALTSPDDKIVTDRAGDTTLLYLSNRRGSPSPYKPLEEFKRDGYSYYVTLNKETIDNMKKEGKYALLFEEREKFAIFKL